MLVCGCRVTNVVCLGNRHKLVGYNIGALVTLSVTYAKLPIITRDHPTHMGCTWPISPSAHKDLKALAPDLILATVPGTDG